MLSPHLLQSYTLQAAAENNNNNNNKNNIYTAIGYGIPHDHSGHQSFTQQIIPEAHIPTSVEGCQVTCEGFYNNNILKGYSFYSPTTTNTNGDGDQDVVPVGGEQSVRGTYVCTCWTDGDGGIVGTTTTTKKANESSDGIGITYCKGCLEELQHYQQQHEVDTTEDPPLGGVDETFDQQQQRRLATTVREKQMYLH